MFIGGHNWFIMEYSRFKDGYKGFIDSYRGRKKCFTGV